MQVPTGLLGWLYSEQGDLVNRAAVLVSSFCWEIILTWSFRRVDFIGNWWWRATGRFPGVLAGAASSVWQGNCRFRFPLPAARDSAPKAIAATSQQHKPSVSARPFGTPGVGELLCSLRATLGSPSRPSSSVNFTDSRASLEGGVGSGESSLGPTLLSWLARPLGCLRVAQALDRFLVPRPNSSWVQPLVGLDIPAF